MAGSTIGKILKLTSFGESHGPAIGGVIDGLPANFTLDLEYVQRQLDKRRPGQSHLTTQRKESDTVEWLSGLKENVTTGAPIAFLIRNENAKSKDYQHLDKAFRPSHADFTYEKKYGLRIEAGGGRSSARETAVRVIAGALAMQFLEKLGLRFSTYVNQVGSVRMTKDYGFYASEEIEKTPVRCPELIIAEEMMRLIETTKKNGNTLGGIVTCVIENVPVGWGEPVFDRLNARLGQALFSINAVKGVEFGSGFEGATKYGTEQNDIFNSDFTTQTNNSGGIQGGISNGMPITFRVAFKPVATLMQQQISVNKNGEIVELEGKGRHDACVVPRAVPIVEAMAAFILLDAYLENKCVHL